MALNQHASNLIDITTKVFNGEVTNLSPTDGLSLISNWLDVLQSDKQPNQALLTSLSDLRAELQSGNLDSAKIQGILNALTNQTEQLADSVEEDSKPKLISLSKALQGLNQLVSGSSKQANTGGQAPMTSTVGSSALTTNNDELAGRTGGTASNVPIDMDDTTGSNGGSTAERFSGEDDDTGDSSYSTEPKQSRSDSARVDGMGISGGAGDTDYSQSGGRSQY